MALLHWTKTTHIFKCKERKWSSVNMIAYRKGGGWGEEKRESDIVSEGKVEALGSTKTPVGLRWPEG